VAAAGSGAVVVVVVVVGAAVVVVVVRAVVVVVVGEEFDEHEASTMAAAPRAPIPSHRRDRGDVARVICVLPPGPTRRWRSNAPQRNNCVTLPQ
jgi:hypothetical protein